VISGFYQSNVSVAVGVVLVILLLLFLMGFVFARYVKLHLSARNTLTGEILKVFRAGFSFSEVSFVLHSDGCDRKPIRWTAGGYFKNLY
jgi:hypothetical protein